MTSARTCHLLFSAVSRMASIQARFLSAGTVSRTRYFREYAAPVLGWTSIMAEGSIPFLNMDMPLSKTGQLLSIQSSLLQASQQHVCRLDKLLHATLRQKTYQPGLGLLHLEVLHLQPGVSHVQSHGVSQVQRHALLAFGDLLVQATFLSFFSASIVVKAPPQI